MAARRSDGDRPDYFRDMPEEFERRPGGPDRSPLRRKREGPTDATDDDTGAGDAEDRTEDERSS